MDDYAKGASDYHCLNNLFVSTSPDVRWQIPGIIPTYPWLYELPIDVKLNVVRQVARHLRELFSLRFAKAVHLLCLGCLFTILKHGSRKQFLRIQDRACCLYCIPSVLGRKARLSFNRSPFSWLTILYGVACSPRSFRSCRRIYRSQNQSVSLQVRIVSAGGSTDGVQ